VNFVLSFTSDFLTTGSCVYKHCLRTEKKYLYRGVLTTMPYLHLKHCLVLVVIDGDYADGEFVIILVAE
jgi:hypothetical protein